MTILGHSSYHLQACLEFSFWYFVLLCSMFCCCYLNLQVVVGIQYHELFFSEVFDILFAWGDMTVDYIPSMYPN